MSNGAHAPCGEMASDFEIEMKLIFDIGWHPPFSVSRDRAMNDFIVRESSRQKAGGNCAQGTGKVRLDGDTFNHRG